MARRMIEKRARGFFGYVFLALFWAFNIFMAYAFLKGLGDAGSKIQAMSGAEKTGGEIGMVMGATFLLGIWAMGAVILGLFCILTRGKREWIEVTDGTPMSMGPNAQVSGPQENWKSHDTMNRIGAVVAIVVIIIAIAMSS